MKIQVPGFGDTRSVEYSLFPILYFHKFVEYFTQRGYVRGKSIRAAPYDWRLAAGILQTPFLHSIKIPMADNITMHTHTCIVKCDTTDPSMLAVTHTGPASWHINAGLFSLYFLACTHTW